MSDIVPIGGFPSIIPKDLYNKIEKETKRGKEQPRLSIKEIMEDETGFIIGGEEENIKIV